MNKTFKQVITDKTEEVVFGNILDSATNAEIKDYFFYRYVCKEDEDYFIHLFQKNLKLYKNEYNQYLRIQHIEFDPMITRYLERQVLNQVDGSGTETLQGEKNGSRTDSNTGTITIKTDNIGTGTGTDELETSASGSHTNSGTNGSTSSGTNEATDRTRNINSMFPQANVASATVGMDDTVSMAYASTMSDAKSNHEGSDSNTTEGEFSENGSTTDSGTSSRETSTRDVFDGTSLQTNNLAGNRTSTETDERTTSKENTESSNMRERFTGRENYDSATLLSHARDYVRETDAFIWLVSKLEKCFIGNLRYGEE